MSTVLVVCAGFTALVGLVALAAPSRITGGAIQFFSTRGGLLFGAGFRIVFGIALWFSAPSSSAPLAFRILGVVLVASGLSMPLIGPERLARLMRWFVGLGPAVMRIWGVVAVAFGVWLITATV